MTAIVIDPEFHAAIPPLSSEELLQLEENIRRDGCLDALVMWPVHGQDILLDGHNRYKICTRLHLPFRTTRIAMATREDALIWILQQQLGRRNLSNLARIELALKLKPMLGAQAKRRMSEGGKKHGNAYQSQPLAHVPNLPAHDTRASLARLAGVSGTTFASGEKVLAHGAPEVIQAARAHTLSISAAVPLTVLPKADQPAALDAATQPPHGKKISMAIANAVVHHMPPAQAAPNVPEVVATVQEQLAQGKEPRHAVAHAFQQHEVIAPTPAMATAVAQATGRRVPIPATDGLMHDGRTKAEEQAIGAKLLQNGMFFRALETLATLPDLHQLIDDIPTDSSSRVNDHLARAIENLGRFAAVWKANQREKDSR